MECLSALVTWLGSLEGARLARVLEARGDVVAGPEPGSVGELAERLLRPGSVAAVLPRLTLPCLQVAEALAALAQPAPRDRLAELLGVGGDGRQLDAVLEVLAGQALVWPDGAGALYMAEALRGAWDAPLGLDASLEELLEGITSDELRLMLGRLGIRAPGVKARRLAVLVEWLGRPERVVELVAEAPVAARRLLERLAEAPAEGAGLIMVGSCGGGGAPGERWAMERGLLVADRYGYGPARMPAEVALALRGPGWRAPFEPEPPVARLVQVTPEEVAREASAATTAFVGGAVSVLGVCSAAPPWRLKSGGIGARELGRIGKAARVDDAVVRLVLESAYGAGLVGKDGDRVAPGAGYDDWTEREPAEQFAELVRAWWDAALTPTRARDEDGKALPALADAPGCEGCVQARHGVVAAAAGMPAGYGVRDRAELGQLVFWQRPFADSADPDRAPHAEVVREAELLGVLGRGALSPLGVALSGDARELVAACRELVPTATGTVRIGGDLTAVVSGTPAARLAALLDSVADRESSGTASVWRFSARSVRRALDAGRSGEDIAADLADVAAGPLPQPLAWLIADAARGHGRARVAPAGCVIHGEEPALLAELAAHRALAPLGLRQLAPTVLVSRRPLDATLDALRAEGYGPVAETADGVVRVDEERPLRVPGVPQRRGARVRERRAADVDLPALAARLLAAPAAVPDPAAAGASLATGTEEAVARWAKGLTYADLRQLAHAIDTGGAVTVEYLAASGNLTVRTLSDLGLDPPYLEAWCHLRDDERVFTLSRIQGVMPA
ncbi:helicase-associated domain-containing protein [Streptomyces sp. NPDC087294]|uniref:helicase-associated domain-containing protein n=1 Tax=Streptomyces sp. NPDC087294 TaxID=3365777 RepID=UPI0037F9DAA3